MGDPYLVHNHNDWVFTEYVPPLNLVQVWAYYPSGKKKKVKKEKEKLGVVVHAYVVGPCW